jgi:hypothetical protein
MTLTRSLWFPYAAVSVVKKILARRVQIGKSCECSFRVIDDFLGEIVEIDEIVGFFKAFVPAPEDVELGKDSRPL